jgi:hypothetical protein
MKKDNINFGDYLFIPKRDTPILNNSIKELELLKELNIFRNLVEMLDKNFNIKFVLESEIINGDLYLILLKDDKKVDKKLVSNLNKTIMGNLQ